MIDIGFELPDPQRPLVQPRRKQPPAGPAVAGPGTAKPATPATNPNALPGSSSPVTAIAGTALAPITGGPEVRQQSKVTAPTAPNPLTYTPGTATPGGGYTPGGAFGANSVLGALGRPVSRPARCARQDIQLRSGVRAVLRVAD